MYHSFFNNSSFDGHLNCFHVFDVVDCTAVKIALQIPFLYAVFISFEYIPRSRMAGSAPFLIQLSANVPAKAMEDRPNAWSPITHVGDLNRELPIHVC